MRFPTQKKSRGLAADRVHVSKSSKDDEPRSLAVPVCTYVHRKFAPLPSKNEMDGGVHLYVYRAKARYVSE